MHDIRTILANLVRFPSITPYDEGCQNYIQSLLEASGFKCQRLENPPVSNLYAQIGQAKPLLIFAGHTDVVPVGEVAEWTFEPFNLHEENSMLYGRGVADMKGGLASLIIAAQRFVQDYPDFNGSLGFLLTSAEEGDHYDLGTPYVMEQLNLQNIQPDYCIIGEPSSQSTVGDMIRIGRRGSLSGHLTLRGKQGHVAYPHLAINPIHQFAPVLYDLVSTCWDNGNLHFPPTSFQISHIQAGGYADNIIPGELNLRFNFRYSTEQTATSLKQAVHDCFKKHSVNPEIEWQLSGEPFLTAQGKLLEATLGAIQLCTQLTPELSTGGGTSDGRFIAPYGVEVIELGPVNATIHQVNESVALNDLETLVEIYYEICKALLV